MIKVYTTPTCVYCHALMEWLDGQDVKYQEIDATTRDDISSVPVTEIDTKDGLVSILGFDRPAIKEALSNLA